MHSHNTHPVVTDRHPPTFPNERGSTARGGEWVAARGHVPEALWHSVALIAELVTLGLACFVGVSTSSGRRVVPSARSARARAPRPRSPIDGHRQHLRAIRIRRSEPSAPCPIAN